jgi:serine/threonine-protein kinase
MPPPTSSRELLDRVRRSGLVPVTDLETFLADLPAPLTPPEVLDRLLAAQLITPFQADRLAAGKYKGFILGSYVILDRLGGGATGQVYLAEHTEMRRLVAIKVLPVPVAENTVARERFLREARTAATLDHPNIIPVFDLNREGRLLYLVMEYVEGVTLQALVAGGVRVAIGAAADYARQVARGLQHAHDRGIVHRDIKPSNLFLGLDGAVKILDLGLVRSEADADSRLTAAIGKNAILGTADYLPPEQAVDSSGVDGRADVYALGATLYFLLAGHPMFPTGSAAQKLMWQQWKDPTPIRDLRPDVPEKLARGLHKALAKKPADRYQTPLALAEALAPFAAGPAPPPRVLTPTPPPRGGGGHGSASRPSLQLPPEPPVRTPPRVPIPAAPPHPPRPPHS